MSHAIGLNTPDPRGLAHLSRGFLSRSHARPQQARVNEARVNQAHADESSRSRISLRLRSDTFVRQSAPTQALELTGNATAIAEPQSFFASSLSARLKASSSTLVRQDSDSGSTTTVQRDRLDLNVRLSQFSLNSGDIEGISSALEGQTGAIERVFDAASLLGDFSTELSNEFLGQIRSALEGLGGENEFQSQATKLDLKIRVRSETVRVENAEDGSVIERSVQRIDIKVRFVSLTVSGEVGETQEPIEADVEGRHGHLRGLGAVKRFDVNGGRRLSFNDIAALADEVIDVSAEQAEEQGTELRETLFT